MVGTRDQAMWKGVKMNKSFSVCGCDCAGCEYLKKSQCPGCFEAEGKVWWVQYASLPVCPIYSCVTALKKLDHCGMCPEVPCKIWRELKDPNLTHEQHEAGINDRVQNLKSMITD